MKYMKRSNTYKANNVLFDVNKTQAWSYGWWKFVDVVNGKVVFNNYRYSVSTSKHQSKVRSLLRELGIKIDLAVECHCGLQSMDAARQALKDAYQTFNKGQIKAVKQVFKIRFSRDEIQQIYDEMEEKECQAYLGRALKYQEKKELEQQRQREETLRRTDLSHNPILTVVG